MRCDAEESLHRQDCQDRSGDHRKVPTREVYTRPRSLSAHLFGDGITRGPVGQLEVIDGLVLVLEFAPELDVLVTRAISCLLKPENYPSDQKHWNANTDWWTEKKYPETLIEQIASGLYFDGRL